MKGKQGRVEVETSLEELGQLGFVLSDLRELTLPLSGEKRVLVFLASKSRN
jgi:hypothetical protein